MKILKELNKAKNINISDLIESIDYSHPPWYLLDLIAKHGDAEQDLNRRPGYNVKGQTWPFWYGEIKGIYAKDLGWADDGCFFDIFIGSKGRHWGVSGICLRHLDGKVSDVKLVVGFSEEDWEKFNAWVKKQWPDSEIVMR